MLPPSRSMPRCRPGCPDPVLVGYFMTQLGLPAEMIAQMRQSPMWPGQEAVAPTLAYDVTIMANTQRGDPLPLRKWAAVTVPTLVMDGTVFLGRADRHAYLHHGAQELATILPHARLRMALTLSEAGRSACPASLRATREKVRHSHH